MRVPLNKNLESLKKNYLFVQIEEKVKKYRLENTSKHLISLGIGDVTLPLSPSVAREMAIASAKMSTKRGFCGYGNVQGIPELRRAISKRYLERGVKIDEGEIFINHGAKDELCSLVDIFGDSEALIIEPTYPVYAESNLMAGKRVEYISSEVAGSALAVPKNYEKSPKIIYLCSPNNPTGEVYTAKILREWVRFAEDSGSLIIFDAAYEAFIRTPSLPHSIYEIEGAEKVAIEVCSFSKMAGFTGLRCGWSVVPRALVCENSTSLHDLLLRRKSASSNGVSFVTQHGAMAALSQEGVAESIERIDYYMENARILSEYLKKRGVEFTGGDNSPYIWINVGDGVDTWAIFDKILHKVGVIVTPGEGFGDAGKGHIRVSALAKREDVINAIERWKNG